jgi:hypothetical protein
MLQNGIVKLTSEQRRATRRFQWFLLNAVRCICNIQFHIGAPVTIQRILSTLIYLYVISDVYSN